MGTDKSTAGGELCDYRFHAGRSRYTQPLNATETWFNSGLVGQMQTSRLPGCYGQAANVFRLY